MDPVHFDGWTRKLQTAASRRAMLPALTLGAIALAHRPDGIEARKKRKKRKKKPTGQCGPCETYANGLCQQKPVGAACRTDAIGLSNGSCAKKCIAAEDCGGGCTCGGGLDGAAYCIEDPSDACGPSSFGCTTTADCPRGHQ